MAEHDRQQEIERLRALPYEQYLRTAHWRAVREAALRRSRGRCGFCGMSIRYEDLEVHHRKGKYSSRGQETAKDVIALCLHCHRQQHPDKVGSRRPSADETWRHLVDRLLDDEGPLPAEPEEPGDAEPDE
jgi:5-methylcytosine-specific restriction endonuclease McrA